MEQAFTHLITGELEAMMPRGVIPTLAKVNSRVA